MKTEKVTMKTEKIENRKLLSAKTFKVPKKVRTAFLEETLKQINLSNLETGRYQDREKGNLLGKDPLKADIVYRFKAATEDGPKIEIYSKQLSEKENLRKKGLDDLSAIFDEFTEHYMGYKEKEEKLQEPEEKPESVKWTRDDIVDEEKYAEVSIIPAGSLFIVGPYVFVRTKTASIAMLIHILVDDDSKLAGIAIGSTYNQVCIYLNNLKKKIDKGGDKDLNTEMSRIINKISLLQFVEYWIKQLNGQAPISTISLDKIFSKFQNVIDYTIPEEFQWPTGAIVKEDDEEDETD